MLKIYFKNTCSTCRTALQLIRQHSDEKVEVVEYVEKAPTPAEIRGILRMLGIPAEQLVRKKEKLYKERYDGKKISDARWVEILSRNPVLIQRPIIVKGRLAIIGRPAETVIDFVKPGPFALKKTAK